MRHTFSLVLLALSALVVGGVGPASVALAADSPIAVVGTVAVGATPDAIAVDPATHRAYVANRVDGSVSVVSATGPRVIATVPVGRDPEGIAVDSANNRIYVANTGSDTVSVIDGATNRVIATVPTGHAPSRPSPPDTPHRGSRSIRPSVISTSRTASASRRSCAC